MGGVASKVSEIWSLFWGMRSDHKDGNTGANPTMDELEKLIKEAEERAKREQEERVQAEERAEREQEERAEAERRADEARRERERLEAERLKTEELLRLSEQELKRIEAESQRLQDERIRAEQARQAAEEDSKRLDEDRRQAAAEKKQAEEERWKAEEDKAAAEMLRKAAEEESQRHREAQARAEEEATAERARAEQIREEAKQKLEEVRKAKEAVERELREGIRPVNIPTRDEFDETRRRLQYQDGLFHFAVAGTSGSGKSSLINALRGLRPKGPNAAGVGVIETTLQAARYPDSDPANPFVWYDIPGSGTLKIRDWQYFNEQGLYIFDCIIVLFDNRFTETDIAILRNCALFNIPAYIVRSKSHMHIDNEMGDAGDSSDEDDAKVIEEHRRRARESYVRKTRASVSKNLQDAGLPDQRVYLVDARQTLLKITRYRNKLLATANEQQSNNVPDGSISDDGHTQRRTMLGKVTDLLGIVKSGDLSELDILDELDLLRDLLSEARTRRSQKREETHGRFMNKVFNSSGRFLAKTYRDIKEFVPHVSKSDDVSRMKSPFNDVESQTRPLFELSSSEVQDLSEEHISYLAEAG
ncbi:hypothetical protein WOLCODRAFT_160936 [Wolfiporia cocos MD-104 SS10]|uniref:IRG-type G domain-containing protein n=1 Tax=Wolfiporia cocos (strain MD-104) TaxID=742152 RepID=A0A2H3JNR7_WOLCO|nr:hypothetical protein WOLCODRAFT_160936 [Wolfiporia cocos MD-104 SS10]